MVKKTLPLAILAPVFLCQALYDRERVKKMTEEGRDETSLAFHSHTVLCAKHNQRGSWVRGSEITSSAVTYLKLRSEETPQM